MPQTPPKMHNNTTLPPEMLQQLHDELVAAGLNGPGAEWAKGLYLGLKLCPVCGTPFTPGRTEKEVCRDYCRVKRNRGAKDWSWWTTKAGRPAETTPKTVGALNAALGVKTPTTATAAETPSRITPDETDSRIPDVVQRWLQVLEESGGLSPSKCFPATQQGLEDWQTCADYYGNPTKLAKAWGMSPGATRARRTRIKTALAGKAMK